MTTMNSVSFTCGVCKKESKHFVLCSTNRLGHCDLDQRPPEMQRSTMYQLIQECPYCGNVSYDIENTEIDEEFLKSEEYKNCNNINFNSDYSKTFYKAYLIAKENNHMDMQFIYARDCAWSCDDFNDKNNAVLMRKICIDLINKLIQKENQKENNSQKENSFLEINYLKVLKLDFMRRACEFDDLINEFEGVVFNEELLNNILQFEIKKAKEHDDACYTMDVIN